MTAEPARYDLLLVPEDGGHVLPDAAARLLLRQLALLQLAIPYDEAVAREWVEIYMKPGVAAHLVFSEGSAPDAVEVFREAVFRFSNRREPLPFGEGPPVAVAVELRGALHTEVLGTFRQRVADAWQMRVAVYSRPHTELPPHRVVAEDEKRPVAEKKEPSRGAVGVRVEEF